MQHFSYELKSALLALTIALVLVSSFIAFTPSFATTDSTPGTTAVISNDSSDASLDSTPVLTLFPRWNLISLPTPTHVTDFVDQFSACDIRVVWGWDQTLEAWRGFFPGDIYAELPFGPPRLWSLEVGQAYWVYALHSCSAELEVAAEE